MSFILDALKKSESDRQRQSGPSLFEVKVAPPRRRLPVWAVAIAVLLGINVIVISWMLLRRPAAQPTQQAQQAQRAQPTPQAAAASNTPAAAPPAAMLAPAGSGGSGQTSGAGTASAGPPPTAAGQPPAADAAGSRQSSPASPPRAGDDQIEGQAAGGEDPSDYAPAVEPGGAQGSGAQAPGAAAAAGSLPLYQQIVTSDGLPALHLDLHVYADRPQDRFVMINMHRLGEGDSLPEGVQVDAIRPDGVVLTYQGTRFLLPRN